MESTTEQAPAPAETVRVEYGVRWSEDDEIECGEPWQMASDGGEAYARRVSHRYRHDGAVLVQREARYSAWAEVDA